MTENTRDAKLRELLRKGVRIPVPGTVDLGEEVDPRRISGDGVVLYPGTRLYGGHTFLASGARLGAEAPATVVNCYLGPRVELRGGVFQDSVFLAQAHLGSGAQVREGCILEEEAGGGHTVGLKQTILFPFVTLGSLINFCDCFLAGGTSRKDHSEVGSSYIHFNYTPHQDKATPSLLGDAPRGVMLRERPIFLGGQGGLVGPCRLGFGTVIAAGVVWRKDCLEGNRLLRGDPPDGRPTEFHPGLYGDLSRRVTNNVYYLANLLALRQWYLHVRGAFLGQGGAGPVLREGLLRVLDMALRERRERLQALAGKMETSIRLAERVVPLPRRTALVRQQREFLENAGRIEAVVTEGGEAEIGAQNRKAFLACLQNAWRGQEDGYIRAIQSLSDRDAARGTNWLRAVVAHVVERALDAVPACRL